MIRYPDTLPEAVDPEAARIRLMNAHSAIKAQGNGPMPASPHVGEREGIETKEIQL